MNIAESLAREIRRVSGIRQHYEAIGDAGKFALMMIDGELEQACVASGTGDVTAIIRAHEGLKGIDT